MLRAERGLGTKDGKGVVSKWGNATLAFTAPGQLDIATNSRKVIKRTSAGLKAFLKTGGPVTAATYRDMTRGVWKSTLEAIYVHYGPLAAFRMEFDSLRRHILRQGETTGWMVTPKEGWPSESVRLQYEVRRVDGRVGVPVKLDVFGIHFYTDLLRRDLSEEQITGQTPWPANVWVF
jgi:hypothetical protein